MSAAKKIPQEPATNPRQAMGDYPVLKKRRTEEAEEGEGNWLVSYADLMTLLFGFFVILQSFSKVDDGTYEKVKKETAQTFGGEYKGAYDELSDKIEKIIDSENLKDKVVVTKTDRSLDLAFDGQLFFASGSIELESDAASILEKIVPKILEETKSYWITIEGHTDNRPISQGLIASNWELSSLRATRVLRFVQDKGYDPTHLKSIGWGDTRPILPNADSSGKDLPDNRAKNRRVIVRISKSAL